MYEDVYLHYSGKDPLDSYKVCLCTLLLYNYELTIYDMDVVVLVV